MKTLILAILLASGLQTAEGTNVPNDLTFIATLDGSTQGYIEILPPGSLPAKPDLLIALHGHGSDRKQFASDGRSECRAARDAAAEAHMIFVSPDYRAPTSWMGPAAEADLVQLIGIYRQKGVGRVVLTGGSMGGTSTLIFTALHPELIAAACAMNPTADLVEYAGFPEAIAASYGGTRQQVPGEYRKRSPVKFPQNFAGIPVSFTTGGKDTVVPPDSAMRLAKLLIKQAKGGALLVHVPEGGHSTSYEDAKTALAFAIAGARKKVR